MNPAPTTHTSTVAEWMGGLAESNGSPGGGAAAGVMLAMAAALTSMVAGYSDADGELNEELAQIRLRAGSLRDTALRLADDDSSASRAFGSAFALGTGDERDAAIREASIDAARASAAVGERAAEAVGDLGWLAEHGNRSLIADITVAFGALRAAITGARTNVSFDLASLRSTGETLGDVRERHPALWATVQRFDRALERIDGLTRSIDGRAAPTD